MKLLEEFDRLEFYIHATQTKGIWLLSDKDIENGGLGQNIRSS